MTSAITVFPQSDPASLDQRVNVSDRSPAKGRIKGTVIRSHLDWVRNHRSREETIEFYESLPAYARHLMAGFIATEWLPVEMLLDVDRVIIELFGRGEAAFASELGKHFASSVFSSTRPLARPFEIHATLQRVAWGQSDYEDFGNRVRYVPGGKFGGAVIRPATRAANPVICAATAGFYAECLKIHGCSSVEVAEQFCQAEGASHCRFELKWIQR
jgi:hypothetical protein